MPKPSLGRIVRYAPDANSGPLAAGVLWPAVIIAIQNPNLNLRADLMIFTAAGSLVLNNVPFSETYEPGCWSWPEVDRE